MPLKTSDPWLTPVRVKYKKENENVSLCGHVTLSLCVCVRAHARVCVWISIHMGDSTQMSEWGNERERMQGKKDLEMNARAVVQPSCRAVCTQSRLLHGTHLARLSQAGQKWYYIGPATTAANTMVDYYLHLPSNQHKEVISLQCVLHLLPFWKTVTSLMIAESRSHELLPIIELSEHLQPLISAIIRFLSI